VTGAARGIGRAVAERLRSDGMAIGVNDLDPATTTATARALGREAIALPGDVSDAASVRAMVERLLGRFGRIDVLVTCAGVLYPTRFEQISEAEWRRTLDVNLTAVFLSMQAVAPSMRARRYGRIVNVSSTAGKSVSTLGGAHYTASKAGVLGLTRAAAKELAPHGVTVNAVCPGLIDTEMVRGNVTAAQLEAFRAGFPIPRLGAPGEVAELIAFLASDSAGYITGAAADINGGDRMV
jgi:NAD(P)-dependent dehydrogenase (short-subunit alcohol dehydrogenase family)